MAALFIVSVPSLAVGWPARSWRPGAWSQELPCGHCLPPLLPRLLPGLLKAPGRLRAHGQGPRPCSPPAQPPPAPRAPGARPRCLFHRRGLAPAVAASGEPCAGRSRLNGLAGRAPGHRGPLGSPARGQLPSWPHTRLARRPGSLARLWEGRPPWECPGRPACQGQRRLGGAAGARRAAGRHADRKGSVLCWPLGRPWVV